MNKSNEQHTEKSNILKGYGILLIVVGIILSLILRGLGDNLNLALDFFLSALTWVFSIGGIVCIIRAKRHAAASLSNDLMKSHFTEEVVNDKSVEPILQEPSVNDPIKVSSFVDQVATSTAPILYLRPFSEDARVGKVNVIIASITWQTKSEEEFIASFFKKAGPFIAIGNPREKLPGLGAVRAYVNDDNWQSEVIKMLKKTRLVVLRAGVSEGFLWELNMAMKLLKPEQIVILTGEQYEHDIFCKVINKHVPTPFPDRLDYKWRIGTISGYFRFTPDWYPIFEPLAPGYNAAFQPVFEKLKIPWKYQRSYLPALRVFNFIGWGLAIIACIVLFCYA